MGYFSNGTEWEIWANKNCHQCQHEPDDYENDPVGGPIEFLHIMWNYDAVNDRETDPRPFALDCLIPRKGIHNDQCKMFISK